MVITVGMVLVPFNCPLVRAAMMKSQTNAAEEPVSIKPALPVALMETQVFAPSVISVIHKVSVSLSSLMDILAPWIMSVWGIAILTNVLLYYLMALLALYPPNVLGVIATLENVIMC